MPDSRGVPLLLAALLACGCAAASAPAAVAPPESRQVAQESASLRSLLHLPAAYESRADWPVILFLHGAGERGRDLELVKREGLPRILETLPDFPFVVVGLESATVFLASLVLAATVVGQPAPDWPELSWVQGGPLTLRDLRGKVVLVRFFTDPECPFCSATAPALNELDREFRTRGLVVIGFYTPKPRPRPTSVDDVRRTVAAYGFRFPVAVDDEWKALRRLWLDRADSGWTSASLLIDRAGVVRHVHPGGVFAKDSPDPKARRDYDEMRAAVERLLAEKESERVVHP